MSRSLSILVLAFSCAAPPWLSACGNPLPASRSDVQAAPPKPNDARSSVGEPTEPPFSVRGELDGLLLIWFDEQGSHSAARRSDVPEAHRARVRVDSLSVAPDKRLDPDHVYVADLTAPGPDGRYPVRKSERSAFDAWVVAARPAPAPAPATAASDVTIYMASWCGACRSAAAYLRSRNVAFTERDIEKDPEANGEMQRKARSAGKVPRGVPVIDFRGHLLLGFDRDEIDRLLEQAAPI